jgi:uncharacterized protein (DUF952 family)
MSERLFHLVLPADWRAADPAAPWAPPSLASEGFLHLSFARQLQGTLEVHFAAADEVWLLEVDPEAVAADLALEPSRGGELFPHLHRALGREEVLGWWRLVRDDGGALRAPDLEGPRPAGSERRPGPPDAAT